MISRCILVACAFLWIGCCPARPRNRATISDDLLVQVDVVDRVRQFRKDALMASAVALREVGDASHLDEQPEYYANIVHRPFSRYFRDTQGDRVTLLLRLRRDRDARLLDLVRRNAPLALVGWVIRSKFSNPASPLVPPEPVRFKLTPDSAK